MYMYVYICSFHLKKRSIVVRQLPGAMDLFHCVGEGQSLQPFLCIKVVDSLGSFQLLQTSKLLTSLSPTNKLKRHSL